MNEKNLRWKDVTSFNRDPYEFYEENYKGISGDVLREIDTELYDSLIKTGDIEYLNEQTDYGLNPFLFFEKYYKGKLRSELLIENPELYDVLWSTGDLEKIPIENETLEEISHHLTNGNGNVKHEVVSLKKIKPIKKWSEFDNKKLDPIEFYQENYEGITRGVLKKIDPGLYDKIKRSKLLSQIPTLINEKRSFGKNALEYYRKHYNGLNKTELRKVDECFYIRLRNDKLLDKLPKESTINNFESLTTDQTSQVKKWSEVDNTNLNPLDYYLENYANVSMSLLKVIDKELFEKLDDENLIHQTRKTNRYDDPLEFYNKYLKGMTRNEIALNARGIYEKLREIEENSNQHIKYNDKLLEKYNEKYSGLTRGELQRKDKSYYETLRRNNLLFNVPLKKRELYDDPVKYYKKNYEGYTRYQLLSENRSLYRKLSKIGKIDIVPRKNRKIENPLDYYKKYYDGVSKKELLKKDRSLYQLLWNQNLLDEIK